MSENWFRSKSRYGLNVGLCLFTVGIFLFFLSPSGDKLEKFGLFLLTFGALMIGMGYTAHIALKSKFQN
jgi:hypothetical protein